MKTIKTFRRLAASNPNMFYEAQIEVKDKSKFTNSDMVKLSGFGDSEKKAIGDLVYSYAEYCEIKLDRLQTD